MFSKPVGWIVVLASVLLLFCNAGAVKEEPARDNLREKARQHYQDGNFQDAYDIYSKLILDPGTDPVLVGSDLDQAVQCLRNLNRSFETNAFREEAIKVHEENWRFLWRAGLSYAYDEHYGYITAGEFYRGYGRRGGQYVSSVERDRTRALQLLEEAMNRSVGEADKALLSGFYTDFANALMQYRSQGQAWRLQILTDLAELPDCEEGYYYGGSEIGAPVDTDGNPIFHYTPETWASARSDGERWRWLLRRALDLNPQREREIATTLAQFLMGQFGVQTLSQYSWYFARHAGDDAETSAYALHTLGEDETLARLATGVKRFKLPEEFNFIRIFKSIAEGPGSGWSEQALQSLAGIFENRRQYVKAAAMWEESKERFGPGHNDFKGKRLNQIRGNFGQFEPVMGQPAGSGATVEYRFRNGSHVHFEAHEIDIDRLLGDIKDYLESNPGQLDWNRINVGSAGYRLVRGEEDKYIGRKVAAWDLELEPRPRHFDKRITVTTPLQKAGAYLVTARMEGGNTSKIIIWVHDLVLVKKAMADGTYFYVADAVTGTPVSKANVEFFGYRQERVDSKLKRIFRKYVVHTLNFAEFTNEDGELVVSSKAMPSNYNWLIMARTGSGRLAFMGFSTVWYHEAVLDRYDRTKAYIVTDRPVYRPKQAVKFKTWVRRAVYGDDYRSLLAGQGFAVLINDAKGEKIFEKAFTADEHGGFDGELTLAKDAALGSYSIQVYNGSKSQSYGTAHFRVEEYKKPEFEVTVEAPHAPVTLGESFTATIKANYYFGAPVTRATVKYKVTRTGHDGTWYPPGPWDWFYGPGYWWFAYDYLWYPGWRDWGCRQPFSSWMPRDSEPPEVVVENEIPVGEDGTVKVTVDTAFAKEIHGDQDHRYQIVAEVRDESRRTIVGSGAVLAARKPFKVYVWLDRGYYRVGDTTGAHFSARTLDGKPVQGNGVATLLRITYDDKQEPVETPVQSWDLGTNEEGRADLQMTASRAGQYRISYALTDGNGRTEEGGYIFCIRGEGFDGAAFRFNHLELIADKKSYAPGEQVRLLINTDRTDSTVVLFVKPFRGIYPKPRIISMQGKSAVAEIDIEKADMPNFFVEAFTVSGGRVHEEVREIVVPPEKRVLSVEVMPSAEAYKPGEEASIRIRVKDHQGKPFEGSAAITVYDKAVEYISGGSNVPEIKSFFWKWRRSHSPYTPSSLTAVNYGVLYSKPAMEHIGVFGYLVPEETDEDGADAWEAKKELPSRSRQAKFRAGRAEGEATRSLGLAEDAAAPAEELARHEELELIEEEQIGDDGGAPVEPTVRKQFADTAYFAANVATDGDGFAEVTFDMPENLTMWKIRTWAVGHGTRVGEGQAEVRTVKNLLLRLQAPRFFVEKDEVVLSANLHNYLESDMDVKAVLELEGGTLEPMAGTEHSLTLASMGERRVDWRVKVVREGEAVVRMKVLSDEESDAMEMRFPVYVHGMAKTESFSGAIRPDENTASINFDVPEERRISESLLEIRYSPSLASAMVDAIPYLAEYPYGCTEQTLNRFLPSVITQKVLLDLGLNLAEIREKRTNLNAQEIGDDPERAKQWKRWDRNAVFEEETLKDMVKTGLMALTAMQVSDGGWGWFSGWGERSYPHTTALVVHGLQIARENDVAIVPGVLERGIRWLQQYQKEQVTLLVNAEKDERPRKSQADNLDAFVYMVLADEGQVNETMRDFLYRDRTRYSLYGKAMFGLALHRQGDQEKLDMILKNIEQYLVKDPENQTAYLNLGNGGWWWYWYGSEIETLAYYLKLLSRVDPKGEKASGLAKYLINHRKHATYWNATRDTALCIEALADYIRGSGEARPDMTLEIFIDGNKHKEVKITAENLFTFDNRFVLRGDAVESGEHVVEFKKTGKGPLYFNVYLTYFSLEDFITRAGLEVKVNRKFYRLIPREKRIDVAGAQGQAVTQKVEKYDRAPIENLDTLKSGDLVEIELEIDSKNDYEYLVFEDMKAAGFEPVEVRSGYVRGGLNAYMELRDERVAFFMRRLPRGKHSIAYRMRAETPGAFSALPARAFAMYAPELKGNSDELKMKIED